VAAHRDRGSAGVAAVVLFALNVVFTIFGRPNDGRRVRLSSVYKMVVRASPSAQ
jgi:hypothetical protein